MEQSPDFRIVGKASPEEKEGVKEKMRDRLINHIASFTPEDQKLVEQFEYPKNEREGAFIRFANEESNRVLAELGIEPWDIPIANYHPLPTDAYKEAAGGESPATTFHKAQAIILNADYIRPMTIEYAATILHETLHLKSHLTFEMYKGEDGPDFRTYRAGVSVHALKSHENAGRYHEHFRGLHEAIVAAREGLSFERMMQIPELADERAWLQTEEAQTRRVEFAKKRRVPSEDIILTGKDTVCVVDKYAPHKRLLTYICREIHGEYTTEYATPDAVFIEFVRAQFTGNLMTIGKLVERTFGASMFRVLGNMDDTRKGAVLCLETLQRARSRVQSSKTLKGM